MLRDVPRLKPGLGRHCAEAHAHVTLCPLGQRRAEPTLQGGNKRAGMVQSCSGFTLIEARASLDRESNARRWLAATFLSLDVGADSAGGFDGLADRVEFAAWLETADGWFERCHVALGRDGDRLVATVSPGQGVALMDGVRAVAFDYLLEPGLDARWVREWVSPVSAPIAVRIRVGRGTGDEGRTVIDTLLFLIKERG